MSEFQVSHLDIESWELVRHLLLESGQENRDAVDIPSLLKLLGLRTLDVDFENEFGSSFFKNKHPRGLLSFPDKLIAFEKNIGRDKKKRFTIAHEIAHYVLPKHQHNLYICDKQDIGGHARLICEKEANSFAADLLFMGDRFKLEANSVNIGAVTMKNLADKYCMSYESTARRLVELSFKPSMFIVFGKKQDMSSEGVVTGDIWGIKYCIASAVFGEKYGIKFHGQVPEDVAGTLMSSGRDIKDSVSDILSVDLSGDDKLECDIEYFSNTYNIFAFLIPRLARETKAL